MFSYPLVLGLDSCYVQTAGSSISVLCSYYDGLALGYWVMVQASNGLRVVAGETRDLTPVVFKDMNDGTYNVVVFALTSEGIIHMSVGFTAIVTVRRAGGVTTPSPFGIFVVMFEFA